MALSSCKRPLRWGQRFNQNWNILNMDVTLCPEVCLLGAWPKGIHCTCLFKNWFTLHALQQSAQFLETGKLEMIYFSNYFNLKKWLEDIVCMEGAAASLLCHRQRRRWHFMGNSKVISALGTSLLLLFVVNEDHCWTLASSVFIPHPNLPLRLIVRERNAKKKCGT